MQEMLSFFFGLFNARRMVSQVSLILPLASRNLSWKYFDFVSFKSLVNSFLCFLYFSLMYISVGYFRTSLYSLSFVFMEFRIPEVIQDLIAVLYLFFDWKKLADLM